MRFALAHQAAARSIDAGKFGIRFRAHRVDDFHGFLAVDARNDETVGVHFELFVTKKLTVDFDGFERQGFAVQMQFARRVFAFRVRTSGKGARNECFFSIKIKFKLNVFEQMCRRAVVAAMNGLRHEVPSSQSAGRSNCPAGCSGFKHFEEF